MAPDDNNVYLNGNKDLPEIEASQPLQINEKNKVCEDEAGRGLGIRHLQVGLLALAGFMAYAMRANLSVAIVVMVNNEDKGNHSAESESTISPTYNWDQETQGLVLSSFLWGYLTTQIPAGVMTERYGGHTFLSAAMLVSAVLTLLLPLSVYFGGWQLLCANRVLQGIVQGFVFPSVYTLLGVWAPPEERGFLSSAALGAQLLGTNVVSPVSGLLSGAFGWPSVFYCCGVGSALAGITLILLGANYPSTHRFISQEEKTYVQKSLGGAKVRLRVPWRHIFKSAPVWAAILTLSFQGAVFLTFLTKIPTYLGTVLEFNIEENGVLSSLPYFVAWILSYVFSWSSDFVTKRRWVTLTQSRKIFNSIAHFGSALCVILMAFADSPAMSVCLLTLAVGALSGSFPGVQANFVDLAPNYSGPIFSVANFLAASLGLTGPIIIGFVVTESGNADQWRTVFFLIAAVLILSNVVFIIFASAETQHWNWPDRGETYELSDQKDGKNDHFKTKA